MSSLHREAAVSPTEDQIPQIILDYNANKGGVDDLDKVGYFTFFMQYLFSFMQRAMKCIFV